MKKSKKLISGSLLSLPLNRNFFIRSFIMSVFAIATGLLLGGSNETENQEISSEMFQHHYIAQEMPTGEDKGWGYGTPTLADFDKDGTMDYSFGVRGDSIYWFEFRGWDDWERHTVGPLPTRTLGATTFDVDGDGWTDIVTGGYWYRNLQDPRNNGFEMYQYDSKITSEIHDIVTADIDGDGQDEIIAHGDGEGLFWYKIPEDPGQDENWQRTTITLDVLEENEAIHGGLAPNGVGDLNGNGYADIVLPDRWLENKDGGTEWEAHDLPFARKRGPWGLSAKSWIVDLNNDGRKDIVMADCDQQDSHAAWMENKGGQPPAFEAHFLPLTASGTRGSFHSLAVADFNGNGLMDIFTVEQEDTSIPPEGATPRWYIWENIGDEKNPEYVERVVFDGELGGHDALVGDIDGDGTQDICAKIWSRWPDNANSGREHADALQNLGH
ncbi:MAG: FG-GAP repeat domain-containing protein [Bacteroidota bacterium]